MRRQLALAIAGMMGHPLQPRLHRVRQPLVPNPVIMAAVQAKRDRRNQHRLNTWTGIRHDTVHVRSTVMKLEPQPHQRYRH
jgi:hypothetical protein